MFVSHVNVEMTSFIAFVRTFKTNIFLGAFMNIKLVLFQFSFLTIICCTFHALKRPCVCESVTPCVLLGFCFIITCVTFENFTITCLICLSLDLLSFFILILKFFRFKNSVFFLMNIDKHHLFWFCLYLRFCFCL